MNGTRAKRVTAVICAFSLGLCAAVQGATIYVDDDAGGSGDGSSWVDAFVSLQDALAAAQAGDEVRVAQGIYRPDQGADITPGDVGVAFELPDGVAIMGGFAGVSAPDPDKRNITRYETILSGDLASDDILVGDPCDLRLEPTRVENSRVVVAAGPCSRSTVLSGLTIAAAYAPDRRLSPGAGLLLSGEDGFCGPSIRNCTFIGHVGGAIWARDASPELIDCIFEGNAAPQGGAIESATTVDIEPAPFDFVVKRCNFIDNYASDRGGALYGYVIYGRGAPAVDTRSIVLDGCTFEGNRAETGGAVYANGYQSTAIKGCQFARNMAGQSGGALHCGLASAMLADCRFERNQASYGGAIYGTIETVKRCHFIGNVAYLRGGAICGISKLVCENCLFAGNLSWAAVATVGVAGELLLANCTVADNRSADEVLFEASGGRGGPRRSVLSQCIVRDPVVPPNVTDYQLLNATVTFSNVQGGFPGEGNVDVDPLFADPGYWDEAGTPGDITDDTWIAGDYHLKSQAGRWDPIDGGWVIDDVTSPCIDAGDPMAPIGEEPFANGGFINLGAYGGTAEASKSYFGLPRCQTHMAGDINGDCKVDLTDLLIVTLQWMPEIIPPIAIVEPQDGAVFEDPTVPILIHIKVNDPDFQVTSMQVRIARESDNASYHGTFSASKGADAWLLQWLPFGPRGNNPGTGVYTIVAEATDGFFRAELSEPVVIVVEP